MLNQKHIHQENIQIHILFQLKLSLIRYTSMPLLYSPFGFSTSLPHIGQIIVIKFGIKILLVSREVLETSTP